MRRLVIAIAMIANAALPALAQNTAHKQPRPEQQQDPTSDEKRAEINALIEAGQKRQDAANAKTLDLWSRWTYAVCIGCGPIAGKIRVVYTTPGRVLAGIPAAQDDARDQAVASRGRRT